MPQKDDCMKWRALGFPGICDVFVLPSQRMYYYITGDFLSAVQVHFKTFNVYNYDNEYYPITFLFQDPMLRRKGLILLISIWPFVTYWYNRYFLL